MYQWKFLKDDVIAGIVVFLVAIPLCMGIALASGAPVFAGVLTGIIGGIVVGLLSDSHVSVSGPAAGMIAIVLGGVSAVGGFQPFLLALLFAGILQIVIGLLRVGFIADYIPTNVIQGLLAAIGILIIIKQLPLAFGYYLEPGDLHTAITEAQRRLTMAPFQELFANFSYGATIISLVSIAVLIYWQKIPLKICKVVPAAIVVVVIAIVMSKLFSLFAPSIALHEVDLIRLPSSESFSAFVGNFQHPKFSAWTNPQVYIYAVIIAIVASLETLLNLEASEKIDSHRRYCSRNKELFAQGVGNTISGLLGGIPITSVIIRSSVNIQSGARTKVSTVFHGFLLLVSLTFLTDWLNLIPIACLASILIVTGYKLARVSLFTSIYRQGFKQFIPFVVTIIAILFTNLLTGVLIGLACSFFYILMQNSKAHFMEIDEIHAAGHVRRIQLPGQVSFLSKASMVKTLEDIKADSKVVIDASSSRFIDLDILNVIKEFQKHKAAEKNIEVNLEGFKNRYSVQDKTDFITAVTSDLQSQLTADKIMQILYEGNQRFVRNTPIHKNYNRQISQTADCQHPLAIVLSCIDSRVPIELIFDTNIGDIFVARVAGNILNDDIIASVEYACEAAGSKVIVVLGHESCGAIKAACDDVKLGHVTQLLKKIKPAIEAETTTKENRTSSNETFVSNVCNNNVEIVRKQLLERSEIIRKLHAERQVDIVGGVYEISTGKVKFDE